MPQPLLTFAIVVATPLHLLATPEQADIVQLAALSPLDAIGYNSSDDYYRHRCCPDCGACCGWVESIHKCAVAATACPALLNRNTQNVGKVMDKLTKYCEEECKDPTKCTNKNDLSSFQAKLDAVRMGQKACFTPEECERQEAEKAAAEAALNAARGADAAPTPQYPPLPQGFDKLMSGAGSPNSCLKILNKSPLDLAKLQSCVAAGQEMVTQLHSTGKISGPNPKLPTTE